MPDNRRTLREKIRSAASRLRRAGKSKNGKTLLANFTSLTVLQVAGYVFPLVTLPYLARVIGVANFGKIAFASSVMIWFQTVVDWGFNYSATREVARKRNDREALSRILSTVLQAKAGLMVAAFGVLLALTWCIPAFSAERQLLVFTFLLIPGHIMFPDWFFQGMQKMKYLTLFNLAAKALFTLLVFVVVRDRGDYVYHPLLTAAGYLAAGLIALHVITRRWHIRLRPQPVRATAEAVRASTDIFVNQIVPNIYNSFSVILLGMLCGHVANGLFDAGRKIALILQQVLGNISRTFFPFLANRIDKHASYARASILLAALAALGNSLLARPVVRLLFSDEFLPAVPVVWIASATIVFNMMYQVYGINYMILQGYEKPLRRITLLGSLVGFALAYPLITLYSYVGTALVILVANMILGTSVWMFVKRKTNTTL